jgi:hypothetical protein
MSFFRPSAGARPDPGCRSRGPGHPRLAGSHTLAPTTPAATGALGDSIADLNPACSPPSRCTGQESAGTRSGWPSVSGRERGHPGSAAFRCSGGMTGWAERSAFRPLHAAPGFSAVVAGRAGMQNRPAFRSCIPAPPPVRPVLEAPHRARVWTHTVRGGQPGRSLAQGEPSRLPAGSSEWRVCQRLPLCDRHVARP